MHLQLHSHTLHYIHRYKHNYNPCIYIHANMYTHAFIFTETKNADIHTVITLHLHLHFITLHYSTYH